MLKQWKQLKTIIRRKMKKTVALNQSEYHRFKRTLRRIERISNVATIITFLSVVSIVIFLAADSRPGIIISAVFIAVFGLLATYINDRKTKFWKRHGGSGVYAVGRK